MTHVNNDVSPDKVAISVAPMEGLTTFPTRLWLYMASAPKAMTTPFLRVTKNFPERNIPVQFIPELTVLKGAFPYEIVPQFITGEPDNFLRACDFVFPHLTPVVEINCGCPCPTSSGRMAGSGILAEPDVFQKTVLKFNAHLGARRLAVKMRTGIGSGEEFNQLFQSIKNLPLARLTIHGRTRKAGYKGMSDWDLIRRASAETDIPVVGSGDVTCERTFQERVGQGSPLKGVMIGRGSMGNPWIFDRLTSRNRPPVSIDTLLHSLFCFVLVHELWQVDVRKLFARIQQQRLGFYCGYDSELWQRSARILMQTLGGPPLDITDLNSLSKIPVGGNSLTRLKVLWGYMRTNLPAVFMKTSIMKAADAKTFFAEFQAAAASLSSDEAIVNL